VEQEDRKAADEFAFLGLAMLSISSAIVAKSASPTRPARKSAACSRLQA
jgi:hypothetical protein